MTTVEPKKEITLQAAISKYLELRTEVEAIEAETKARTAEIKGKMATLEAWITSKAQEQGLDTIPVKGVGTAMWTTHYSATVAARDALFGFVKEHNAFDLLENRVNKTAVRAYIDAHGEPPPGVNFSSVRTFSVRKARNADDFGDKNAETSNA